MAWLLPPDFSKLLDYGMIYTIFLNNLNGRKYHESKTLILRYEDPEKTHFGTKK